MLETEDHQEVHTAPAEGLRDDKMSQEEEEQGVCVERNAAGNAVDSLWMALQAADRICTQQWILGYLTKSLGCQSERLVRQDRKSARRPSEKTTNAHPRGARRVGASVDRVRFCWCPPVKQISRMVVGIIPTFRDTAIP